MIKKPHFLRLGIGLIILFMIVPLFLFSANALTYEWVALIGCHTLLLSTFGLWWLLPNITVLSQKYSYLAQLYNMSSWTIFRAIVSPTFLGHGLLFLPILWMMSFGEVTFVSTLPTIDLVTVPRLMMWLTQKYKFQEAHLLFACTFGCFIIVSLFTNHLRGRYVNISQN